MNTALKSKQSAKCDCGQIGGHRDQIMDYPVGSHVRAIVTIDGIGGSEKLDDIPKGTIGLVRFHTDDGRACINFNGSSHTFHYPKQCIERVNEADVAAIEAEAVSADLASACEFLCSQVERLAEKAFSDDVGLFLSKCDALSNARRVLSKYNARRNSQPKN